MITLSQLRKVFRHRGWRSRPDIVALDRVDLHATRGEICGIVGPSGAGKSTLIRCVNLLERPTSGTVEVDGRELTSLDGAALRQARQRIGMIFQHFNLLSAATALDNVALPLRFAGVGRTQRRRRAAELLDRVGLADRATAYPAQLSGGQQQRVAIARALAADPTVLLCDEVTSALDPESTRSILGLLRELNQELGLTILLITHEMAVVRQVCDSVALMGDGRIVEAGRLDQLPLDSMLARGLLPEVPRPSPVTGGTVLDVVFFGDAAGEPVIAGLTRRFGLDVNILAGAVEMVGGRRIGRLWLELPGCLDEEAPPVVYLRDRGLHVGLHRDSDVGLHRAPDVGLHRDPDAGLPLPLVGNRHD